MLDVRPPHQADHTWKDLLLHIAAISIGLLLTLGLEATVEWIHHKHQAQGDQNIVLLFAAVSGIGWMTSQCSTTLPFSDL